MLLVQDALTATDLPQGGVATIGNYDGIHRGQRAILERVVARARALDGPAVIITFDPHPLSVLRPESVPPQLTTPEQKRALLEAIGIDAMAVIRFNHDFARTPAETFVRDFLHRKLAIAEIYVGADFAFGHRREGNLALLEKLGGELGIVVEALPEVHHQGARISSTRIRQAVLQGQVHSVMEMLGRPYSVTGVVVRGDRMGQRIGWPTINLETPNELIPADGVYAGQVSFPAFPAMFDCATNIGTRPTVYENYRRVVEGHVLDFSSDVYGQEVEISFHKRLREERMFPSVMDLAAQIGRDVESTREYFAARRRLREHEAPAPTE